MHTLGELITGRVLHVVTPDWSVQQAAELMAEKNIGAVPVLAERRLVGIFSERDLLTRVIAQKKDPALIKVGHVMTRNLIVASASDDYPACLEKMKAAGCRHLPVITGDQLVGIVSMRDLLLHDVKQKDSEIRLLNEYIHFVPSTVL
ncbi:MAG: CBS domain-containing protein [candidate division KSB1 bacterium]|nr:CBS domain-containing protein [candidate division KSB1 bacterium]MDZ7274085.1 CBS domain-containing protein [candidate division KSB1 bacterium]MDZ7287869.1 CBS domain-containing protein [candidate division KSB1 bacterium]MDZ7296685.1 CBS domain-containing protein [candidate division KSB1 bacterium]MDZ7347551.1 CBS domain-containing protein [candidate division KSB1 bacterium]